jgi:hypothetical protein
MGIDIYNMPIEEFETMLNPRASARVTSGSSDGDETSDILNKYLDK